MKPVQVKGALWYAVPKMGWVSMLMDGNQRSEIARVLAYGLFGYAAALFVLAVVRPDRRGRVLRTVRAEVRA